MRRLLLVVGTAALVACGGGDAGVEPPAGGEIEPTAGDDGAEEGTLIGRFDGDAQLEGGCAWLEPTGGRDADLGDRIEPLFPQGYEIEFAPDLRLVGPGGDVVAERGDELVVEGGPEEGMASICQVGPHYRVDVVLGTVDG